MCAALAACEDGTIRMIADLMGVTLEDLEVAERRGRCARHARDRSRRQGRLRGALVRGPASGRPGNRPPPDREAHRRRGPILREPRHPPRRGGGRGGRANPTGRSSRCRSLTSR
ncbi:MAG: hypothetical protein ACRDMA_07145 [Solirubrobacterales bacterium]